MKKIFIILFICQQGQTLSLDEYLLQVAEKNKSIQSLKTSQLSSEHKQKQGDLELSPFLTLSGGYLDDERTQANSPSYIINRQKVKDYSLGLAKKFSSGTQAQISVQSQDIVMTGLNPPPFSIYNNQAGVASLGLSISQALWKDGFGRATALRQDRENLVSLLERHSLDLRMKQILIQAEAEYWNSIFLQDEFKLRVASLQRAKRIETWVKQRLENGIGDKSDYLNAQGLVASRELQLLSTQDELVASELRLKEFLQLNESEKVPRLDGNIGQTRDLQKMLGSNAEGGTVVRLDSYLAVLEAKVKNTVADEVTEGLKPELSLVGSYKTNSLESSIASANQKVTNTDKPTSYIGLQLKWLLDTDTKDSMKKAAQLDLLSTLQKKEKLLEESENSWHELIRRHSEMSKKIGLAEKLNQIQNAKAASERDKLAKGRSITSQVITAEQDAAEAESTLNKLRSEHRKLESQARHFIKVGEL